MAIAKPFSKRDFSTGQYDREYQSSQDEVAARGLEYCRNVLSSPLGEIKTRPGFIHRFDLDSKAVQIPYRMLGRDVILVFQDGTLDLYEDRGGPILERFVATTPTPFTFPNTSSNNQGGVNLSDNSAGSMPTLYKAFTADWVNLSPIQIPQQANFLYFATWDFGANQSVQRLFAKVQNQLTGAQALFTKQWWNEAFLQFSDDGVNWQTIRADISLGYARTTTGSGLRNISGVNIIVRDYESHRYWRMGLRVRTAEITNSNFYMSISGMVLQTQVVSTTITSPYAASDLDMLKYDQADSTLTICSERDLPPYEFKITAGTPTLTAFNATIFQQYGNPKCVRYFQNRRWFAGFNAYPLRVIASLFGNPSDFTGATTNLTTGITAASAIVAEVNQLRDMIRNLYGGENALYCVSHDGISMIEAGNSVVGTNQMNFLLKSDQKASNITPAVKDNIMFLVSEDREKIFVVDFDLITDKFVAPEITLFARDIMVHKIKQLYFIDTRERMVYGILDNGEMFAILYDKSTNRLGFFPLYTEGQVVDMSSIRYQDNNYFYAVVNRGGGYFIERLQQIPKFKPTDAFMQTPYDKNKTTKINLMDTFYFDSVRSLRNESEEIWNFDSATNTLSPGNVNNTDLSEFIDLPIRFFLSQDPLDFYEIQITENLGNNNYIVEVQNKTEPQDNSFIRFQTGFKEFQYIVPRDYYVKLVDYTEQQTQVLLSQTQPGSFSLTIPANVVQVEIEYAGANGQGSFGTTPSGSTGMRALPGAGAIKRDVFNVNAGDTINGAVGGVASVPTFSTASVGGTGFSNGGNPVNDYNTPIGQTTWERGGGGGGSTGYTYQGTSSEADGGGGGSWAPPLDQGQSNTGQGGKGGGPYGGPGGVGNQGISGRKGQNATTPGAIGFQNMQGTGNGYIKITGFFNVAMDTRFVLESETKLVALGYFQLNSDLDPYIGQIMRFFPTESMTGFIDLNILQKDVSDPANPFYVVEIVRTANLTFEAGMSFIIVRNAIEWEGTIQVADTGRYVGTFTSENGIIKLPFPVFDIKYGFPYRKIGVVQDNQSYLRKKKWGTIAVNVLDTLALKIGASIDKMEELIRWTNDGFYNSSPIMRNGVLTCDVRDDFEQNKELIFMTDEGLPFCIRAIESNGEMTDRNVG